MTCGSFLLLMLVAGPTTRPSTDESSDFPPPGEWGKFAQTQPEDGVGREAPHGSRPGAFTSHGQAITFTSRSENSALEVVSRRLGWSIDAMRKTKRELEYDLAKETFCSYVPPSYDGTADYGLLVWVNFGHGGCVPDAWREVLDKHKLIWIGPENAGNGRFWPVRVGLALDAVANMKSRYRIDDARVFVAGLSGGGRAASMLGIGFPDVFAGGCYICGCDSYRDVPTGRPHKFWARNFFPPPRDLFRLAKTHSRHVLLTSEGEINHDQTRCNYRAFVADGFRHVSYFEVPGMGHSAPNAQWFEKAIEILDTSPDSPTTRAGSRR